jgi:hypothetical protein
MESKMKEIRKERAFKTEEDEKWKKKMMEQKIFLGRCFVASTPRIKRISRDFLNSP